MQYSRFKDLLGFNRWVGMVMAQPCLVLYLKNIIAEEYYEHRENGSKVTGRNTDRIDKGQISSSQIFLSI